MIKTISSFSSGIGKPFGTDVVPLLPEADQALSRHIDLTEALKARAQRAQTHGCPQTSGKLMALATRFKQEAIQYLRKTPDMRYNGDVRLAWIMRDNGDEAIGEALEARAADYARIKRMCAYVERHSVPDLRKAYLTALAMTLGGDTLEEAYKKIELIFEFALPQIDKIELWDKKTQQPNALHTAFIEMIGNFFLPRPTKKADTIYLYGSPYKVGVHVLKMLTENTMSASFIYGHWHIVNMGYLNPSIGDLFLQQFEKILST